MLKGRVSDRVEQLIAERQPFVRATVVRVRHPTSVRPGDAAVVLSDGTIDGFVGGVCAESSVRLHALRVMETGEPLLLRLVPGEAEEGERNEPDDGLIVERNPCLSGGTLEIFLEPHLPAPRLVVLGTSPIAQAVERVAQAAGYDCRLLSAVDNSAIDDASAVIVASHGNGEEAMLEAALTAGVPYVALVASVRRGTAVRDELSVPEELRAQLHTPAGLEIGAESPGEIAVSILAELVALARSQPALPRAAGATAHGTAPTAGPAPPPGPAPSPGPAEAIDPVCGMRVAVTPATPQLLVGEESVYFCREGCRDQYAEAHADAVVAR